jgi:hypothetical protein
VTIQLGLSDLDDRREAEIVAALCEFARQLRLTHSSTVTGIRW